MAGASSARCSRLMFDKEGVLCGRVSDEADGWWSEGGAESG